jgi:ubiquinone/menaquinone biosynthesis C-methylase UbiE
VPDVYATIAEADPTVVEWIAGALETRAADPQQEAMRDAYLADVPFPPAARVLEVGCGTGPVSRALAARPGVAEVVGVDPSPGLLARARTLASDLSNLSFREADGRALPFADAEFDAVVFHTTLCHVPEPERALAEAHRVLRPAGWLAVFDGDYATITLALGEADPLQACAEAVMNWLVHDRWFVRKLPTLARSGGFAIETFRSFGYAQVAEPTYLLTLVDRGADFLAGAGTIGVELAAALKAEARQRVEAGRFFGQIAYASLTARKAEPAALGRSGSDDVGAFP